MRLQTTVCVCVCVRVCVRVCVIDKRKSEITFNHVTWITDYLSGSLSVLPHIRSICARTHIHTHTHTHTHTYGARINNMTLSQQFVSLYHTERSSIKQDRHTHTPQGHTDWCSCSCHCAGCQQNELMVGDMRVYECIYIHELSGADGLQQVINTTTPSCNDLYRLTPFILKPVVRQMTKAVHSALW